MIEINEDKSDIERQMKNIEKRICLCDSFLDFDDMILTHSALYYQLYSDYHDFLLDEYGGVVIGVSGQLNEEYEKIKERCYKKHSRLVDFSFYILYHFFKDFKQAERNFSLKKEEKNYFPFT